MLRIVLKKLKKKELIYLVRYYLTLKLHDF